MKTIEEISREAAEKLWGEGYLVDPEGENGCHTIGSLQEAAASVVADALREYEKELVAMMAESAKLDDKINNHPLVIQTIANLQADRARLDWLDHADRLFSYAGYPEDRRGSPHVCNEHHQHFYGANVRDVIDTAMKGAK